MKRFLDGPVDRVAESVTRAAAEDAFTFARKSS